MYFKRDWVVPVGIGIVSFGAGAITGYFFRKFRKEVEVVYSVLDDLEEVKSDQLRLQFDGNLVKRDVNKNLQELNKVLTRMRETTGDNSPSPLFVQESEEFKQTKQAHPASRKSEWEQIAQVVEDPMIAVNEYGIEVDPNWNYEEELKHRSPDAPYIIHRDEFFSNEMDFEQTTIMYYQKDDVLCDEADMPIPRYDKFVGELKFGHGSLDRSICYVRNEHISHEWEVILDEGSFAVEVLGAEMENEIKASDLKHSVPKFRQE
jgi:hypothetical protein